MDHPDPIKRQALSPLDTMVASQADIKAGQVDDFDSYIERIGQQIDNAVVAAEQRKQSADC